MWAAASSFVQAQRQEFKSHLGIETPGRVPTEDWPDPSEEGSNGAPGMPGGDGMTAHAVAPWDFAEAPDGDKKAAPLPPPIAEDSAVTAASPTTPPPPPATTAQVVEPQPDGEEPRPPSPMASPVPSLPGSNQGEEQQATGGESQRESQRASAKSQTVGIVKALRQKVDDLEDDLDAEKENTKAARAEVEALQAELTSAREAAPSTSGEPAADLGQQLEEEQARCKELKAALSELSEASEAGRQLAEAQVTTLIAELQAERQVSGQVAELQLRSETLAAELQAAGPSASMDLAKELEVQREAGHRRSEVLEQELEAERQARPAEGRGGGRRRRGRGGNDQGGEQAKLQAERDEFECLVETERGRAQALAEDLEAQKEMLESAQASLNELVFERDAGQKQMESIASELDAERLARGGSDCDALRELQSKHDVLSSQHDTHQRRADELAEQLCAEQQARTAEAGGVESLAQELEAERVSREELQSERDESVRAHAGERRRSETLEQQQEVARGEAVRHKDVLANELAAEAQARAADGQAAAVHHNALRDSEAAVVRNYQALTQELGTERKSNATAFEEQTLVHEQRLQWVEQHATNHQAFGAEQHRRGDELHGELTAVRQAHEAIFARYTSAVEDIDRLKLSQKELHSERAGLINSLEEVKRVEQEREAARAAEPPPEPKQMKVDDVLISVSFTGVPTPLEMRPWDTNLEDVVREWLTATQRSESLRSSLVKYLRHLDDTADSFPLRVEASLLDVHEQFAV